MERASHSEPRVVDSSSGTSKKYTGVRRRSWGKYVTEIRLPNSRKRIWLGSYDTAEKAARAFDAAQYCLRGGSARLNFPDDPPLIENARSMPHSEIKVAAARFAHSSIEVPGRSVGSVSGSEPVPMEEAPSAGVSLLNHEESPTCAFTSTVPVQRFDCVVPELPLGNGLFDPLDSGLYLEFNEYAGDYDMVPPDNNHWPDYNNNNYYYYEETNADDGLWSYQR